MQSSPRIEELRQKFHENPRRYFAPLANEYRKAGDPEQAIAICRAHLAQQPGHMSGHVVYAQALYDARRTDEARVVFQQALALDPENIIVLRHLGDIARQRGEVEAARSWYSRALDGDPQDAEVAAYLAELTEPLLAGAWENAVAVPAAAAVAAAESPVSSEAQTQRDDSPYLETEESSTEGAEPATTEDTPPAQLDIDRRLTPAVESSPIVTRTLAELYLNQGHVNSALDIYRQLAEREPEDAELQARIEELSAEQKPEPVSVSEADSALFPETEVESERGDVFGEFVSASVQPESELTEVSDQEDELMETTPLEHEESKTAASEAGLMEEAAGAGELADGVERQEGEIEETVRGDKHFTEQALPSELWDTADFWGAGFFNDARETDDIFGLPHAVDATGTAESGVGRESAVEDTRSPAGGSEETAAVTTEAPSEETTGVATESAVDVASEGTTEAATAVTADTAHDVESDHAAVLDMVGIAAAEDVDVQAALPEEALQEPATAELQAGEWVEVSTEGSSLEAAATEQWEEEEEPAPAATPVPAPRQVTVREFFATLGSMHQRSRDSVAEPEPASSPEAAAETGLPGEAAAVEQEYPFADDAFSSLFADIQVSAEDSRAAVALSGAVAHRVPPSTPRAPAGAPPSGNADAAPASDEPAHESEEEIRRFREWLDGLAES